MLVVYIFHKNEIKVLKRLLKIKFLGDCTGYLLKKVPRLALSLVTIVTNFTVIASTIFNTLCETKRRRLFDL